MEGFIFEITPDHLEIATRYNSDVMTVDVRDGNFRARGNSRRSPEDKFDFEVGYVLAFSRAQQRLLRKIEKFYAR